MLEVIDVSQEVMLIEALIAGVSPSKRAQLLRRLEKQQEDARAALKEQADALDKSYEEVRRGAGDPARMADIALEKERADAERIHPAIEALQQKLTARATTLDPEIRLSVKKASISSRLGCGSIKVCVGGYLNWRTSGRIARNSYAPNLLPATSIMPS